MSNGGVTVSGVLTGATSEGKLSGVRSKESVTVTVEIGGWQVVRLREGFEPSDV